MFGNMIAFSWERDAPLKGNMSRRNDDGKTEKHTSTPAQSGSRRLEKKKVRVYGVPPPPI